jgi:hypothetical protein
MVQWPVPPGTSEEARDHFMKELTKGEAEVSFYAKCCRFSYPGFPPLLGVAGDFFIYYFSLLFFNFSCFSNFAR